jgi:hypothetical protein
MPAPMRGVDERLKEWATPEQVRIIDAINKHGGLTRAAKALGKAQSGLTATMNVLRRKAALHGYSPDHDLTHAVAPMQKLRGASTLYRRGEPEPVLQWVKSSLDEEAREAFVKAAVAAMVQDCRGLAPITPPPPHCTKKLLAVYPMGDPHFGMHAWAKESGEDFDLSIARSVTQSAIDRLVCAAPAAETAILLPLGDVLHIDDQSNQTPAHKHQLDADGRYVKVLQVCIQAYRHAVMRLLERHKKVVVRFVSGNHDPHAVWALAFTIDAFFENEPRVEVDLTPSAHWFYRFGSVLIGATHGDKTRPEQLLGVMAADRAKDWGETKHRYWYTGHVHHQSVREFAGVTQESFRTLAAKDSYAAAYGYRAGRDMRLIVHHADHGEVERHRCDIGMIE